MEIQRALTQAFALGSARSAAVEALAVVFDALGFLAAAAARLIRRARSVRVSLGAWPARKQLEAAINGLSGELLAF